VLLLGELRRGAAIPRSRDRAILDQLFDVPF
jgi:hypothetical protein